MKKNIAIKLDGINKEYVIHHEKPTLMETIFQKNNGRFKALKNINLIIQAGERIGIIGANGSGKTTFLKIIAGITSPTGGKVSTNGKMVSLIDLSAGFHPDLTGLQNIYLNGMIIGMTKAEIDQTLSKIISTADIGKFMDLPLYTYSSGMGLRLGFSIAVHSSPNILILDENMAVGDENFKHRSQTKINDLISSGTTIIFASHILEMVRLFCKKIVWLDKGKIKQVGGHEVIDKYLKTIKY